MIFAHVRAIHLFVIEVDTAEEGLLHEHCEPTKISAFEEQTRETG